MRFEQLFLQHFAEVRMKTANKDKDNSQAVPYKRRLKTNTVQDEIKYKITRNITKMLYEKLK